MSASLNFVVPEATEGGCPGSRIDDLAIASVSGSRLSLRSAGMTRE
jgi:hypothetical protein